jgi:galactokinase
VTLPVVWAAPGRVNLIGEHTDYNDGFVLPFAIPQRTTVTASIVDDPGWTVWSQSTQDGARFAVDDLRPGAVTGWASYVAGVVWSLTEAGVAVPPAHLAISSDVPIGAGLSSSAALECAALAALLDLAGALPDLPRERWPQLAQRAENAYAGVPCGIMDQAAAVLCEPGHALFLDCRTLGHVQVPLGLDAAGLAMLVVDTRATHRHAGGEYAARRATCEAAAAALGVEALRDVTDLDAALAALPDLLVRRRVRHVVTENERVHASVTLLRARQPELVGPLLTQSHASLRDDYEVSSPELDLAVDTAVEEGALGARMTGGGFGGCAIALIAAADSQRVTDAISTAFAERGYAPPFSFVARASAGVARVG